jgi:hypothetical protein
VSDVAGQLSFLEEAIVRVVFHPVSTETDGRLAQTDLFSASVGRAGVRVGWGETEDEAFADLATLLLAAVRHLGPAGGLTADSQARAAASRLGRDELIAWLRARARPAELSAASEAALRESDASQLS